MTDIRPEQLTDEHLTRVAVTYLRQSSTQQVEENVGSTQHQRDQRQYARKWGYPDEAIIEIDEDLGLSGRTAEHRSGFQRLLKLVERKEVGVILVSDLSRLTRSNRDFEHLLAICRATGTLIAINGLIVDLEKHVYRLLARIQACIAEHDNDDRTARFAAARRALARQGRAVHRPPTGYVKVSKGQWGKDPDAQVRQTIEMVFAEYNRLGTVGKLLRFLARNNLQLPIRTSSGGLRWVRPSRSRLYQILSDPAYAGFYAYGRRKYLPGGTVYRLTNPNDWILVPDHHEPYITETAWRKYAERLRSNQFAANQPAGSGPGLVQGLIRCGCGSRMETQYNRHRKGAGVRYVCLKAWLRNGAPICGSVDGLKLNTVVTQELLQALTPPALQDVLEATREINCGYHATQQQRDAERQRARDDATLAEARYKERDPRLRLVAGPLLEDWNRALERVQEIERRNAEDPLTPPLLITDDVLEAIRQLAEDIPALWNAPTTTNQDRKALIRLFVREVRVVSSSKLDFEVDITWVSGVISHHHIFRSRAGGIIARELAAQGWDATAIAAELNRRGITTRGRNRLYSARRVRNILYRFRKRSQALKATA